MRLRHIVRALQTVPPGANEPTVSVPVNETTKTHTEPSQAPFGASLNDDGDGDSEADLNIPRTSKALSVLAIPDDGDRLRLQKKLYENLGASVFKAVWRAEMVSQEIRMKKISDGGVPRFKVPIVNVSFSAFVQRCSGLPELLSSARRFDGNIVRDMQDSFYGDWCADNDWWAQAVFEAVKEEDRETVDLVGWSDVDLRTELSKCADTARRGVAETLMSKLVDENLSVIKKRLWAPTRELVRRREKELAS